MNAWDERLEGDRNAFDLARIVLASMVVLGHSFFLIDNSLRRDPLVVLSGGQLQSGQTAVYLFFVLSGFLVMRSLIESPNVFWFMARRASRIVPGFVVASLVGLVIVGPLTAAGVGYVQSQDWPRLLALVLALKQANPEGVLQGLAVPLVHGTLWSIRYEFDCYILLGLLGLVGLMRPGRAPFTFVGLILVIAALVVFAGKLPALDSGPAFFLISSPPMWPTLVPFFVAGAGFYYFRQWIPKSKILLALSLAVIAATFVLGGAYWAVLVLGTYAILYACLSFRVVFRLGKGRFDLSYGVYLYGWPVQQLVLFFAPAALAPMGLFALAWPLSLVVAAASWILVEHPSLRAVRGLERRTVNRRPALAV